LAISNRGSDYKDIIGYIVKFVPDEEEYQGVRCNYEINVTAGGIAR
jgi:hypothetical protein